MEYRWSRLHATASSAPPVPDERLYDVVDVLDEVAGVTGKTALRGNRWWRIRTERHRSPRFVSGMWLVSESGASPTRTIRAHGQSEIAKARRGPPKSAKLREISGVLRRFRQHVCASPRSLSRALLALFRALAVPTFSSNGSTSANCLHRLSRRADKTQ